MAETTEAVEEKTEDQDQQNGADKGDSKTEVQAAEFSEADDTEGTGAGTSVDLLLNMDVPVTVAIGRVEISVQRLLQLSPGSVLRLDKPIDAPVDLYLKDTVFATGSVVVVEDRFAVRIKEILGTGAGANKE